MIRKLLVLTILLIPATSVFSQTDPVLGVLSEEDIRSSSPVFEIYTQRYQPDSTALQFFRQLQDPVHIVTVMGTWCKDSKKYVPALLKILALSQNPHITSEYIGVNYSGDDPTHAFKRYGLNANPSFIVYLNGIEIDRIVEAPEESMEEDLMKAIRRAKSGSE